MLADGAAGFAVICRAADPLARSREAASFDARTIVRLGEIIVRDGDEWAEMVERVPIR
jgi:hypothetical protein